MMQKYGREHKETESSPSICAKKMNKLSTTHWEVVVTHLLSLALFFAMRSYKYLETRYPEENRRTHILRCKHFKLKNGSILPHSSSLQVLESADLITKTFEFQKNDWRNHTVHIFTSGDMLLCTVISGAKIVKRARLIPGLNDEKKICNFLIEDRKVISTNSAQGLPRLRTIVESIGKPKLGFSREDVGLHSLRSGGAIAIFY